jgi:hypothetical protein
MAQNTNAIRPHSSLGYRPPAPQTSTGHHLTSISMHPFTFSIRLVPKYPSGQAVIDGTYWRAANYLSVCQIYFKPLLLAIGRR